MSACSKKSFSSASCSIFAWRVLRIGASNVGFVPTNTSATRVSNWCFHSVTWVGWTWQNCQNSPMILSPLTAAKAICALKVPRDCVSISSSPRSSGLPPPGNFGNASLPLITLPEFLGPPLSRRRHIERSKRYIHQGDLVYSSPHLILSCSGLQTFPPTLIAQNMAYLATLSYKDVTFLHIAFDEKHVSTFNLAAPLRRADNDLS